MQQLYLQLTRISVSHEYNQRTVWDSSTEDPWQGKMGRSQAGGVETPRLSLEKSPVAAVPYLAS